MYNNIRPRRVTKILSFITDETHHRRGILWRLKIYLGGKIQVKEKEKDTREEKTHVTYIKINSQTFENWNQTTYIYQTFAVLHVEISSVWSWRS